MRGASAASCSCSSPARQQRIQIKSFRAVTARATFLCLCKETWRKETHPAFAPGAAHRVRGAGGIFRGGILPPRKTPHLHVRRPCGVLSVSSAATEGPGGQDPKQQTKPRLPQTLPERRKPRATAFALV